MLSRGVGTFSSIETFIVRAFGVRAFAPPAPGQGPVGDGLGLGRGIVAFGPQLLQLLDLLTPHIGIVDPQDIDLVVAGIAEAVDADDGLGA